MLLQVTTGCSHNKCSFCTMYRDTPFSVESMGQIEKDLAEARAFARLARRLNERPVRYGEGAILR